MTTPQAVSDVLCRLLGEERICIADVGAADGLAKRWRPIAPALRVVAFEPDGRSDATAADVALGASVTFVQRAAAAHPGIGQLHLTRKPRCSSLYPPNRAVVDRYPEAQRYDVVQTAAVECTTVDAAFAGIGGVLDFIKIDTQGTELDVLRGAEASLAGCLGIEVEVEFQPLYLGAALFRDVDLYLSALGFEIFDLRRTFFTRAGASANVAQDKGQLVFGDALYFRPWQTVVRRESVVKLAALMLTYGFADVVAELARACPLVTAEDRQALEIIAAALRPIAGTAADRKDRFVGAGLQLQ
jgi:FkbM family methyltransferase